MKRRAVFLLWAATALAMLMPACGVDSRVTQPKPAITVALASAPDHLGATESNTFVAEVTNTNNTAVQWSLSACTVCGSISQNGVYTAPSLVTERSTVLITAQSLADPTKSASTTLELRPVSIVLAPASLVKVAPGATVALSVALDHDPNNSGVTWSISGAECLADACGTLLNVTSTSVLFRAPDKELGGTGTVVRATSVADNTKSAAMTLFVAASSTELLGTYAFRIDGWGMNGLEGVVGSLTTNGNGTFSGIWDSNRGTTPEKAKAITGSYAIDKDGHGVLSFVHGSEVWSFIILVDADGGSARLAENSYSEGTHYSYGTLTRQQTTDFTPSALAGKFVLGLSGEATGSHTAGVGELIVNDSGKATGNLEVSFHFNSNTAAFAAQFFITGDQLTPPDPSNGRGTWKPVIGNPTEQASLEFVYYVISKERVLLMETDARGFTTMLTPFLIGEVRRKADRIYSAASLSVPMTFGMTNLAFTDFNEFPQVRVGTLTPNAAGSLRMDFDENNYGALYSSQTSTSTYTVGPSGRVAVNSPYETIAYLSDENSGYAMTADPDGAGIEWFEPQTGLPFSIASFVGDFAIATGGPAYAGTPNRLGWMTVAEDGSTSGTIYVNYGWGAVAYTFSGTLTMQADGRGTLTFTTPKKSQDWIVFTPETSQYVIVLRAVSPAKAIGIMNMVEGARDPALFEMWRPTSN